MKKFKIHSSQIITTSENATLKKVRLEKNFFLTPQELS